MDQHEPASYPVHRLSCRCLNSRVTEIISVMSQTERATVQAAWEDYHTLFYTHRVLNAYIGTDSYDRGLFSLYPLYVRQGSQKCSRVAKI
jgi:hypothetical protein